MNPNLIYKLKLSDEDYNINILYTVIKDDPSILDNIDSKPFVETPLHIAASRGHIRFAIEVMNLKPSFASKLNSQGLSPLHLAMENGQNRMALRFVDINKDLVRIKGRGGLTPLHFASQIGEVDILAKFLTACQDSIEDVTARGETALHIAVKNNKYEALDLLVCFLRKNTKRGARKLEYKIINWKDEDDNTILHILAQRNFEPEVAQALKLLLKTRINLKGKNLENKTALDMTANVDIRSILLSAGVKPGQQVTDAPTLAYKLRLKITIRDKLCTYLNRIARNITEEQRNTWMIIAALVATATYQSSLSPTGGVYQVSSTDDNDVDIVTPGKTGKSVLSELDFLMFSFLNLSSFSLSTMAIFIMMPRGMVGFLVALPMVSFGLSFLFSMWKISSTVTSAIVVFIFSGLILFFVFIYNIYSVYSTFKRMIAKMFE